MKLITLDIEVHDKGIAKYLVHGLHDVLWTDSTDEALDALRENLEKFSDCVDEKGIESPKWPEGPHIVDEADVKPIKQGKIK